MRQGRTPSKPAKSFNPIGRGIADPEKANPPQENLRGGWENQIEPKLAALDRAELIRLFLSGPCPACKHEPHFCGRSRLAGFLPTTSRSMTTIPTSGDFLRAFSRTSMAAATRHIAEVLAGEMSYDGRWRGAPKGHSAFTMAELQEATGLSARSVRDALADLARLFGLTILRRHHQRHLFRFTRISGSCMGRIRETESDKLALPDDGESTGTGVTGSQVPVTPYIEHKRNNLSQKIEVNAEANVYRTPWADFIRRFKTGTPAEKVDVQYLWNGFCGLNQRNGRSRVPLAFLLGFLRKYPTTPPKPQPAPSRERQAAPAARSSSGALALADMARPAPFKNRHWHKSDLIRRIGPAAYDERVKALIERYGGTRFAAELAIHGQAVQAGEISR